MIKKIVQENKIKIDNTIKTYIESYVETYINTKLSNNINNFIYSLKTNDLNKDDSLNFDNLSILSLATCSYTINTDSVSSLASSTVDDNFSSVNSTTGLTNKEKKKLREYLENVTV